MKFARASYLVLLLMLALVLNGVASSKQRYSILGISLGDDFTRAAEILKLTDSSYQLEFSRDGKSFSASKKGNVVLNVTCDEDSSTIALIDFSSPSIFMKNDKAWIQIGETFDTIQPKIDGIETRIVQATVPKLILKLDEDSLLELSFIPPGPYPEKTFSGLLMTKKMAEKLGVSQVHP